MKIISYEEINKITTVSWEDKAIYMFIAKNFKSDSEIDIDQIVESSNSGTFGLMCSLKRLASMKWIEPLKKHDFVYLIKSAWSGKTKIGFTNGYCAHLRIDKIRNGDPSVKLVHKFKATALFEKFLHRKYKDFNAGLEWFDLSDEHIEEIKGLDKKTWKHTYNKPLTT